MWSVWAFGFEVVSHRPLHPFQRVMWTEVEEMKVLLQELWSRERIYCAAKELQAMVVVVKLPTS